MLTTSVSLLEHLHDPTDQLSWRRLVDLYAPLLRNWLRRYGLQDHDVEDLLQDIFSVLVRKLPEFHYDPEHGSFRSWLRTVLAHCCQSYWRARSSRPQAIGGDDAVDRFHELADPDSELSHDWDREHDQHVAQRLLKLVQGDFAPTTWKAFQRVVLDGLRAAEVAGELACPSMLCSSPNRGCCADWNASARDSSIEGHFFDRTITPFDNDLSEFISISRYHHRLF